MYYILSVGGMVIVRCTECRGFPLLGGSFSINAMLNSIRVIEFVRCTEVVRFLECPLREVPLYLFPCVAFINYYNIMYFRYYNILVASDTTRTSVNCNVTHMRR